MPDRVKSYGTRQGREREGARASTRLQRKMTSGHRLKEAEDQSRLDLGEGAPRTREQHVSPARLWGTAGKIDQKELECGVSQGRGACAHGARGPFKDLVTILGKMRNKTFLA